PASAPRAVVDVTAANVRLGPFQPGDFRVHARVADGRVEVDPVTVEVGDGRVRARGALELSEGLPFRGTAEVERAGFGQLLERSGLRGAWVDFQAAARLEFKGRAHPFELGGEGELEADRFLLAARPWNALAGAGRDILTFPRGEATFGFRVTPERTDFTRIAIRTAQGNVRGEASIHHGARGGLEVRGAGTELDLTSLGQLAGVSWSGRGATEFEVEGPWGGIRSEALLHLRDFSYWRFALGTVDGRLTWGNHVLGLREVRGQKGQSPYAGEGELEWRARGGLWARGTLSLERGRAEDVVEMTAPLSETMGSLLVGSLQGGASLHVDVSGPGDRLGGTVRLGLRDATYDGRRVGTGELRFTLFDGEGYRLEPSVLVGPLGTLRAEGQSLYEGPLDYRFALEGGSLAEVLGEPDGKVRGGLTVSGKWEGDTTTPVMTAWVTSPGLEVAGRPLGAVHLETRMQGRDLQVWGRPFYGARMALKMRSRSPFPFEMQASAALDSLGTLFPEAAAQGLSGAVSGTLKVQGALKQERSTEGALVLDRFRLQRGDFSGENDGPLRFGIFGGRLNVESFNFRGPNTSLVLAGSAGTDGMDLKLGGAFDMRLAESFTAAFERAGGKVEVTASATGPWEGPQLAGAAEVKDVRLSMKDGAFTLRNAGGRLEFSGARVLVQELSGYLNNGRVRMRGEAALERGGLGPLEAALSFDQVTYRPREWLPLTASGEVLLSGRPGALVLQGAVEVEKLRYEQSLDLQSVLGDLRRGGVGTGGRGVQEEAPAEWLKLDVSVKTGRDVWVDNNLARARLQGELRLTGTNAYPGLLGTIETAEGGEAFYRGNRFALKQGVLEFRERDRVEPVFDLHAETQAREFLVRLHAFGRAASPQVVLQAEPELSEADILSLLTLGVVSRDRTGVGGEAGAGLAAEAFLSASGLGDRVQRFIPRNQVFRDLSFHLSTTYNDASGLVEPTAQLESRFLTEQLKLGMTRPMSGRGTRAQAEYRFDARTSAQVQWDNQVSADFNNVGNLGLELKLRWEVD
ncbi:MAG: translocation/assembly module TamB domain-containing protein, partial [Deltaproteobacteria bacterium]|nr:translocation/assembly module TamB domain-containing protein [Deltaproteobacteria bacterium]